MGDQIDFRATDLVRPITYGHARTRIVNDFSEKAGRGQRKNSIICSPVCIRNRMNSGFGRHLHILNFPENNVFGAFLQYFFDCMHRVCGMALWTIRKLLILQVVTSVIISLT